VLRRLTEWQERVRQTDPANFRRKRRLVSGLREASKGLGAARVGECLHVAEASSVCGQRAGSTCRQHVGTAHLLGRRPRRWLQEWGWADGRLGLHVCGRRAAGAPPCRCSQPDALVLLPLPPQVEKAVKLRRAKLVLLAPNIASLEGGEGGEAAASPSQPGASACPATALAALAAEKEVPLVFALSRQRMGKVSWARCAGHQPLARDGKGPPATCALLNKVVPPSAVPPLLPAAAAPGPAQESQRLCGAGRKRRV
jgi:hypothetical protein